MKLGIIQGRLLPPVNDKIQEFPTDWKREFDFIKIMGLSHIEFIITPRSFDSIIQADISEFSTKISSICCDNLINTKIDDHCFLSKQLRPICDFAIKNNIKALTIPLLEESQLSMGNVSRFTRLMYSYSLVYPDLEFHFEMNNPSVISDMFVPGHVHNFFYTYDTGNMTGLRYNDSFLETFIKFHISKIKNIHLKDRSNEGITVEPGTGDTNFNLVFETLRKLNYNGNFTLQTARGQTGMEMDTVLRHKEYFKKLYEKFI